MKYVLLFAAIILAGSTALAQKTTLQLQDASGDRLIIETGTLTATRVATLPDASGMLMVGGSASLDDLLDAKSGGANFTNSLLLGHQTTGTLNNATSNTGVGYGTLQSITSATNNTAMGFEAMRNATSANANTAMGLRALASITSGAENAAFGHRAGESTTTAMMNTAIGEYAMRLNQTASEHTSVGAYSLYSMTSGQKNAVLGNGALFSLTSGSRNTVVGADAGSNTVNASGNVFIGYAAGQNETGSNKLYIDNSSTASPLIYGDFTSDFVTINGTLRLAEPAASGTNYTAFVAQAQAADVTYTLPSADGTSGQILTTNGSGTLSWETVQLLYFTETRNTTAPNATVPVHQIIASGTETDIDMALRPKGTGALTADAADGTATGGNKRGTNAVDLQRVRGGATLVASGTSSVIGGGQHNVASGGQSVVSGGTNNEASGTYAVVSGGIMNAARGYISNVAGGLQNIIGATGAHSNILGGNEHTITGSNSTVVGGRENDVTGNNSVVLGGQGVKLSGSQSLAFTGQSNYSNELQISANNTAVFGNVNFWLANNNNTASELRFYEAQSTTGAFPAAGTNYTAFKAQAQSADITYTLPAAAPTAGQALIAGSTPTTLEWVSLSGSFWALDGNTVGSVKTLGTNDNYAVAFETNGTERMRLGTNGVLSGLSGFVVGASSTTVPLELRASGDVGAGENYRNTDAASLNVRNTGSTTASHAVVAISTNNSTGGNPILSWDIENVGGWSMGIDNSDGDKLKLYDAWDFSGDVLMTFENTANRIGILDETPDYTLDVEGTAGVASNLTLGGQATAAELRMLEPSGSGSNYTAFKAQAQAADITYTLPASAPTAGQALIAGSTPTTLEWGSGGATNLDGLSDAKSGGTNFANSLLLGHQSVPSINDANGNVAVGYGTIENITQGDYNIAVGYGVLANVTTGSYNVAIGGLSMQTLSTGTSNIAIGLFSMNGASTTGYNNIAIGHEAGFEIDGSAQENTAVGARIFRNQLTGNRNTAVGADAMYNGGTGGNNVAVGYSALSSITTGANNVVIGTEAGLLNQTGSGNVFIGHNAGRGETGSDKLYIDNSSTATPLIYGDFSSNNLTVNGALTLEAGTSTYGNGVDAGNLSNTYIAFGAAGASNDWSYLRQIGGIDNYHVVWDFHDNADDARFSIRSVTSSGATPDVITTRLSLDGSGNLTVGGIGYFNRASATEGGEIELQTSGNTANVWALDEFSGNNEARFRIFPSSGGDLYGLCIEENDGHVGLGTNNPIVPLHVYRAADSTFFRIENSLTSFGISLADNFNVTNWASGAADYAANITPPVIVLNSPNTTSFVFGDHLGPWSDNDYDLGHSFARWRNIYAGNNVIQTSDYRLKDDLRAFEALPLVRRIPVYDYVWKSSGQRQYGFMAHELQEVVPYLVMGTKDAVDSKGNPVYQGLDYSKLTPILTKAIQEQQAVIESQQQTINDLRSRMERMEQALESLLQEKK